MSQISPHAKAFDLPGWPCPPRVRDIPHHRESWGYVPFFSVKGLPPVVQDELGYLWVNGDVVPRFQTPPEDDADPGALVFWVQTGIGLWVHPKSLRHLHSISQLDMTTPGEWLPVNEVFEKWPEFITNHP